MGGVSVDRLTCAGSDLEACSQGEGHAPETPSVLAAVRW